MTNEELIDDFERYVQEFCRAHALNFFLNTRMTALGGSINVVYSSPEIDIDASNDIKLKEIREKLFNEIIEDLSSNREKPRRFNLALTPTARSHFANTADAEEMPLTEFLRRAAFAAQMDPSILRRPEVEAAESAYKDTLGPSRWATKEHE